MNMKLVPLIALLLWYAPMGYYVYLRHIDRNRNPNPDRWLALLAWLVSPLTLVVALGSIAARVVEEVEEMATGPTYPTTPPKAPTGEEV